MLIKDLLSRWRIKVDDHQLDHTAEKLEQIKNRIEIIGAAELLKGIYEMAEHFGEFAEQLLTTAESAGIGADALQRLQYAATQSGVGAEDVTTAMARLSRTLYEAQSGSKEALKTFADIGIGADQVASIHSADQAFNLLSDRVATIQDPIKRQAVLMSLLGRGSYRMAAMMAKGSGALKEMGDQAEASGAVISEGTLHALDDMQNTLETLGMVIKNISATIASYFSPVVKGIAQDFIRLWGTNQDVLKADWHGWARSLAGILGYIDGIIVGLARNFRLFADEHPILMRFIEGAALSLTGLGIAGAILGKAFEIAGWFAAKLGGGLGLLADLGSAPFKALLWGGGLLRGLLARIALQVAVLASTAFPGLAEAALAMGAAIEATPVGWILTGLAAIVLAGEALYTMFFKGGKFKDTWLGKVWEGVKGFGRGVADFLGFNHADENGHYEPGAADQQMAQEIPYTLRRSTAADAMAQLRRESPESQTLLAQANGAAMAPQGSAQDPGGLMVQAPMTVNINGAQDPKEIAKQVGEHFQDRIGNIARNIKRAHAPLEHS